MGAEIRLGLAVFFEWSSAVNPFPLLPRLVRGVMVETFKSRIKVSGCQMFILGYLLIKNMARREIRTLTLAGVIKWRRKGEIYRKFATFHPV